MKVLLSFLILLVAGNCWAGTSSITASNPYNFPRVPLGHSQIIAGDIDAAVLLSSVMTIPPGATMCKIQAEDQNIRWTDDGDTPTASFGMRIFVGSTETLVTDLSNVRLIGEAANAIGNVSCY